MSIIIYMSGAWNLVSLKKTPGPNVLNCFGGIPHSKHMIYIAITAKSGRTPEMKKNLYARIAEYISEDDTISKDDVFIVLTENNEENWSFGRGKAQLIK